MRRYLRLTGLFLHNSLQVALEYRVNFIVSSVQSVLWLIWGMLGTLVFFQYSSTLGGWTLAQALLVVGLFRVFEGFLDGVMRPNITRIVEHIQKGTLDFVLLKPADSQFLASLRQFNLMTMPDFVVGAGLIIVGLQMEQRVPTLLGLLGFVFLLICAAVAVYGLWMLLVTSAFWLVQIENVAELLTSLFETGRFPVTAYQPWLRLVLTFVVPIALMTTFPAAALLGTLEASAYVAAPITALLLLTASRLYWRTALRAYTSASS